MFSISKLTRRTAAVLFTLVLSFCLAAFANDDDGARKIKNKVVPAYPELARRMNLSGDVRLELQVAASGAVTSVKVIGGHPLLAQSAVSAVKQWKYEAGAPGTVLVDIKFNPEQQ